MAVKRIKGDIVPFGEVLTEVMEDNCISSNKLTVTAHVKHGNIGLIKKGTWNVRPARTSAFSVR